ncbi:MAG: hypothetical protein ACYDFT_06950 [Thermoplasmata archaeon]
MFSRREREYLRLASGGARGSVDASFPPGYRRRIQWSIRRKVSRAATDWGLYLTAAQLDARVRVRVPPTDLPEVPLYADPLVSLYRSVSAALRGVPKPKSPRGPKE